jgi:hypothetical protein
MDKWQAIQAFWSNFDINAYDENSIYSGKNSPEMPYIAYNVSTGSLDNMISLSASIFYNESSWLNISKKADEISKFIGFNGVLLELDNHEYLWINRGSPFAQRMADQTNDVRRILINLECEFLTQD